MNVEQMLANYNNYNEANFYFYIEPQFKVFKSSQLGIRYELKFTKIIFGDSIPYKEKKRSQYMGLFYTFDNNKDYYNRSQGVSISLSSNNYFNFMNSGNGFNKHELIANFYSLVRKESPQIIMANRFVAKVTTKNVPFYEKYVVGNIDLRGYVKQEYTGEQLYAAQSEMRIRLNDYLGAVAFGGLALSINSAREVNIKEVLPAGGFGLRVKETRNKKLYTGLDFAWGKGDWGFYFRVGDAF